MVFVMVVTMGQPWQGTEHADLSCSQRDGNR